jgi:hypothetical protein
LKVAEAEQITKGSRNGFGDLKISEQEMSKSGARLVMEESSKLKADSIEDLKFQNPKYPSFNPEDVRNAVSSGPQLNPPEVEVGNVGTAPGTIRPEDVSTTNSPGSQKIFRVEDTIEDFKKGSRLIHDSAELSVKHSLIKNAEGFGYNPKSGMTIEKWAEIKTDELMIKNPDIRYAITHDGNELVMEKTGTGEIKLSIENGEGRPFKVDRDWYESRGDSPSSTKSSSLQEVTKESVSQNNTPSQNIVSAEVVNQRMQTNINEIFGNKGVSSKEWDSVSKLKTADVLSSKNTIPHLIRINDGLSGTKSDQLMKVVKLLETGGAMGVNPTPNENVGMYIRRVLEKTITRNK